MSYNIVPAEDQINDVLNRASESINSDVWSRFPGMSYEEGVEAGIQWVLGIGDPGDPMAD